MITYRSAGCNKQLELTGNYEKKCLAQYFLNEITEPFMEDITKCVADSFEDPYSEESENTLLAADKVWASKHNLIAHPSILINDFTYRGDIDFVDLKQAICSAYKVRPDHCNIVAALEDAENINIYANASIFVKLTMVFSKVHLVLIGILILMCNIGLIWCLRKRGEKHRNAKMNSQVNEAVSNYFALQTSEA